MRNVLACFLVMGLAVSARATDLNLWIVSGGMDSISVSPGATVDYAVMAELGDAENEGLALIGFDLSCTCGVLPQADTPTTEPMKNFAIGTESLGINNPAGYGGTLLGDVLKQVGGGQNTINNDVGNAPYPIGGVITGVAQPGSPVAVATGSFTAPTIPGVYQVIATNVFGNAIVMSETGDPFYKTFQLDPGTSLPLTVTVPDDTDYTIVSSTPASGAIDARQPSDIDGTNLSGWSSIQIDLDQDASALVADDFTVTVTAGVAPTVTSAVPSGNSVTLQLSDPIPAGAWTKITLNDLTPDSICLGFLPADVTGDGTSGALDILGIIDCLNGVQTCEIYQGDVNRSAAMNSQDILTVIDLLNGAGEFDPWNAVSLPASPCVP